MRLIFVRHGESEANILHEFSNRGLKHGLTELGRQQAQRLAEILRPTAISALYTSPLLRAVQTAEIIGDALHIRYESTDALREFDCGLLEGRSDPAAWELYDIVLREWLVNHHWTRRVMDGESFLDIRARFVPFIQALIAAQSTTEDTLLLVGHGGLYRCMLPLILENIDFDFTLHIGLDNTDTVAADLEETGLVCRRWGQMALNPPR